MLKENSDSFSSNSTSHSFLFESQACLSKLTKEFVKKAEYAQITKDEALNACSMILIDERKKGEKLEYLYHSLIQNQILVPSSKSIYLIQDISIQCVLVKLTKCYSPLCTADTINCYSPSCPNRSFATSPSNTTTYIITNDHNHLTNTDTTNTTATSTQQPDYMNSKIPLSILESLSPRERKRQLAIEELLQFEEHFLKQLIVIRDVYAKPLLLSTTTIEESRRITFHDTLFGNYHVLANGHQRIIRELESTRHDATHHHLFPDSLIIGNILSKHFKKLIDPYIRYVSNHVFAEYLYKLECHRNMAFFHFITEQESLEKDFRFPLKSLLLAPIARIGKYKPLLNTIIKNSLEEDRVSLYQLDTLVSDILQKINTAAEKALVEQRLLEIRHGLKLRRSTSLSNSNNNNNNHRHRLSQILPDDVHLVHEGTMELRNRLPPTTCQVFLFSNALMITREKINATDSTSEFTLLDKPIPLHMLRIGGGGRKRRGGGGRQRSDGSYSSSSSSGSFLMSSSSSQPILRQLSYPGKQQRRWNSESGKSLSNATRLTSDTSSLRSASDEEDDEENVVEEVYTISGLKLRHRIKSIKKRMRRRVTTSDITTTATTTTTTTTAATVPLLSPSSSFTKHVMRPRILQIHHLADPTLTFMFECASTNDRLEWKNKIKSLLPNPDHGPFGLATLVRNSNYSTFRNVNGRYAIGCGTIWCSLPFTTSEGRDVIALGTRLGVWVAYTDGSEIFRHILPYNCHQLELFDNRILLARCSKPNRVLGAIHIDRIYPPGGGQNSSSSSSGSGDLVKDFQPLQKFGVIAFAVGTLRGESILCYLRRRRTGSIRLVLMSYRPDTTADATGDSMSAGTSTNNSTDSSPFKKYKEYKPITMQPTDLTIIQDAVYIRSRTEGIEKVDIINWIMGTQNNTFQHVKYSYRISLPSYYPISLTNTTQVDDPAYTTVGYVPLNQKETGLICSGKVAWPVVEANAVDLLQQEIHFETEAKNVVVCYPYLLIFSSHVIEVRHIETTALVQAIGGSKIRCVYVSRPSNNLPIIHITMLHADEDQTKVHQLYLKEPIVLDE